MPHIAKKTDMRKASHRLSVSLTEEQHTKLLEIAEHNKVSVAWVMREAIERLLRDEQPLLHLRQER